MSNTILKKCLAELNEKAPRLDYIKGMLETLIELQEPMVRSSEAEHIAVNERVVGSIPTEPAKDEAAILDARARTMLEDVKKFSINE